MMTMVMTTRQVNAARFKAECLALLDDVAATGQTIIVTKRGKPVARVVPVEEPPSLRGSVTYLVDDDELIAPLGEAWDAER
jgi:prevent-host-death family protein